MAYSYLFFKPKRLPLTAQELDESCVESLTDLAGIKAALAQATLELAWTSEGRAHGKATNGNWLEFSIPPGGTLSMRCSLRADYHSEVQRICDLLGWVAFDEQAALLQPRPHT